MAQLIITETDVDNITILTLSGKITIGEGAVQLREWVREKTGTGRNKIIFNMSDVSYIDSSGLGELISSYTTIRRAGGKLWMCHLTKKIADLLSITKLLTVYELANSVEEALTYMDSDRAFMSCPINYCLGRMFYNGPSASETYTCPNCAAQICLTEPPGKYSVPVLYIDFPTYEGEYVRLIPGSPYLIEPVGRLDLFASKSLEKAWYTIKYQRRVIFGLGKTTELTSAGVQSLSRFCGYNDDSYFRHKSLISIEGLPENQLSILPSNLPIYKTQKAAEEELNKDASSPSSLLSVHLHNP
jgi:anti-sigma B factor antagonist